MAEPSFARLGSPVTTQLSHCGVEIMHPILVFAFCVAPLVPAAPQDDMGSAHESHRKGDTASTKALGPDHSQDEAEIRDVQKRQAEAWNRHDAKAYVELFTED